MPQRRSPLSSAVLAALAIPLAAAGQAPAAPAAPARITVNAQAPGVAIPRDFVGLSLEVSTGGQGVPALPGAGGKAVAEEREQYALGHPGAPNRGLFQFMRNLGPGVLRLGGNSQDNSCWDKAAAPHPEWCKATLTEGALRLFAQAADATGWRLILGLNLKQDSPQWALRELTAGVAPNIPARRIWALEIGNEPDLFRRGNFRPASDSPADQARAFLAYLQAWRANPATRAYRAAGPATCCAWRNGRDLGTFLDTVGAQNLALVTVHNYVANVCNGHRVTIAQLLAPAAARRFQRLALPLVATARAHGLPIAMAETNSVACGGMPGVSDSFAAALWGLDYMFSAAGDGFRTINFHTSYRPGGGSSYNPVLTLGEQDAHHRWVYRNIAEPLYYAMYLFARNAAGARLLPVTVASPANVRAFAVRACPACPVKVFVLNEDLSAAGLVRIAAGAGRRRASLLLLAAPSLSATAAAVRYGGAQFDSNGHLPAPHVRALPPDAQNDYVFSLPTASIALLTLPAGS